MFETWSCCWPTQSILKEFGGIHSRKMKHVSVASILILGLRFMFLLWPQRICFTSWSRRRWKPKFCDFHIRWEQVATFCGWTLIVFSMQQGNRFSMFLILPFAQGGLPALLEKINLLNLHRELHFLEKRAVLVSIPKFSFKLKASYKGVLQEVKQKRFLITSS